MQTIQKGYRGLSLLMDLNWDLVMYLGAMTAALVAGMYLSGLAG